MLATETDQKTVMESYAGAAATSNMRVGNDAGVRTPGDLIAAAGMNKHRFGLAIGRMVTEWDAGAVPKQVAAPDAKALAKAAADSRLEREIANSPKMPRDKREAYRAANIVEKADVEFAEAELRRLQARSTDWQMEEHRLRFQRLKTLPAVRRALIQWATARGWDDAEHIAGPVIQRFLSPVCHKCKGRMFQVVPGTSRTGKKPCGECKGSGEAKVPHHGKGKAMLGHMWASVKTAAADLREGGYRRTRSLGNQIDREVAQEEAERDQRERAVGEARIDEISREAVAAVARGSMTKVRKK